MRPRSIILFERLYAISIVVGIVSSVLLSRSIAAAVPAGAPLAVSRMMPVVMAGTAVFGVLLGLALLYFIARRGSDVALWIFAGLFAIGLAQVVRSWAGQTGVVLPPAVRAVSIVQLVLQAVCLWLLFRPDARAWFRARSR